jgi:hypothetical protein
MAPPLAAGQRLPAVLIISGSGAIDRDGNPPPGGRFDTNLHFAQAFAQMGVASLRYDKLGTGTTGLASRTASDQLGFDVLIEEANAAYNYLRGLPDVDPTPGTPGDSRGSSYPGRPTAGAAWRAWARGQPGCAAAPAEHADDKQNESRNGGPRPNAAHETFLHLSVAIPRRKARLGYQNRGLLSRCVASHR